MLIHDQSLLPAFNMFCLPFIQFTCLSVDLCIYPTWSWLRFFFVYVGSYVSSNLRCFQPMFLPMLSHFSRVQLLPHELPTRFLCPWILERVPCPPLGDLPDPGIESMSLMSPDWQAGSLPLSHKGSLISSYIYIYIYIHMNIYSPPFLSLFL